MSGRLGLEFQPKHMNEEEKDFCRKVIAAYKTIRPVVQFGDLYRIAAPFDGKGYTSLMYVSEAKDKAVFYWWKQANFTDIHLQRPLMVGLDPDKMYRLTELNRIDDNPLPFEGQVLSGRFLMDNGISLPMFNEVSGATPEWSSRVIYLVAE